MKMSNLEPGELVLIGFVSGYIATLTVFWLIMKVTR